jgi:hypothetical protein
MKRNRICDKAIKLGIDPERLVDIASNSTGIIKFEEGLRSLMEEECE